MTIDERISSELRRHAPQVDEHIAWERFQSAAPLRRRVWARRLVPVAAAALGVGLLGFALVQTFPWNPAPVAALESPLRGTWFTIDSDGSTVAMTVEVTSEGAMEITALDDFASVCSGAPSTMTGTGRLDSETVLVIPAPVLTCDDGSEPQALNGGSLEDILRDLTFVIDAEGETLTDSFGSDWSREAVEDPSPEPTVVSGMWPQSSLEEVEEAQELADAGDADFTWQVDPDMGGSVGYMVNRTTPPALVARFLQEELGWEHVIFNEFVGWDQTFSNLTYMRCASGETNPLYPDDEIAGGCAPTIDELTYETVSLDLVQPGRQGPTGIWVVADWTIGAPFSQRVPQTNEAAALVGDYLQARIDGEGAEEYLVVPDGEVPLLYATTAGAPYERFEFEQVGQRWPLGSMEFEVRLFAGETVVEQRLHTPWDGRLGLEYQPTRIDDIAPTTENGQPVAVPYDIFHDGQVTLLAPHPWREVFMGGTWGLYLDQGTTHDELLLMTDPVPAGTGCEAGPAPADIEALVESIVSDPDLETTTPVVVSLGGTQALSMEVVAAPGASVCDYWPAPLVLSSSEQTSAGMALEPGNRMRLYLLDLPEGLSARILAIAVIAPEDRFEAVIDEAVPILDSMEFHAG
jgi:hypothetical protein